MLNNYKKSDIKQVEEWKQIFGSSVVKTQDRSALGKKGKKAFCWRMK